MPNLKFALVLDAFYGDVVNIDEGIVVVNTCSNLCLYNDTVESLIKKHGSYSQELVLKTANANFASIQGRTIFTRVSDKLTIASIFSEHLDRFNEKRVSLDTLKRGCGAVSSMRRRCPLEKVYAPMYFGSTMSNGLWAICASILKFYIEDVIIVAKDGDLND